MTGRDIDELSRFLGGIEQQLKSVVSTQAEDRVASAQYRTDIRKEIGDVKAKVTRLEQQRDLTVHVVGFFGKAAHAISAALGAMLVIFVNWWLHIK